MYDRDKFITYTLPEWDYGDGATVDAIAIRLPPGFQGEVVQIGLSVTETFACDNTAALLEVGSTDGGGEYEPEIIVTELLQYQFHGKVEITGTGVVENN